MIKIIGHKDKLIYLNGKTINEMWIESYSYVEAATSESEANMYIDGTGFHEEKSFFVNIMTESSNFHTKLFDTPNEAEKYADWIQERINEGE